jgi:hypothetical protein
VAEYAWTDTLIPLHPPFKAGEKYKKKYFQFFKGVKIKQNKYDAEEQSRSRLGPEQSHRYSQVSIRIFSCMKRDY